MNLAEIEDYEMGITNSRDRQRLNYLIIFNRIGYGFVGKIEEWEWNIKNITTFVMMVNASFQFHTSKARFSQQQWLEQTDSDDPILKSLHDR